MKAILKKLNARQEQREATDWARKYRNTFSGKATFDEAMDVYEDILVHFLCKFDTLENQEEVIRHNVALQIQARMGILHDDNVRLILRAELGIPAPQPEVTKEGETEDVPRE